KHAGRKIDGCAAGCARAGRRTLSSELLRKLGRDGAGRSSGINRKLKGSVAIRVHIDQNERLRRTGQANWHFSLCTTAKTFDPLRMVKTNFTITVVDRDAKMFQKIITEIAVNPRADGLADVGKIDNSNIDIA